MSKESGIQNLLDQVKQTVKDTIEEERGNLSGSGSDNEAAQNVVPESQRGVSVKKERIERPEVMAHNVVRALHASSLGNHRVANEAAEELVRGGHYGRDFAEQHRGAGDYYSTIIDSDGAFLLPVEVVQEIETLMPTFGAAMNIADIRTRTQRTGEVKMPGGTGQITFSSIAEGGEFTTSKRAFQAIKLNPQKIGALVPWTYEAEVEAGQLILQDVQRKAAEGLARKMDQDMINGDGTSTFNGIDGLFNRSIGQTTLASGSTSPSQIGADNFFDIISAVNEGARMTQTQDQGLAYVLHPNMRQVIRKLKDDNGQYVFAYDEAQQVDTIDGVPIYYTAVLPDIDAGAGTDFGLCGNFSYWKIARSGEMFSEDLREGQIPDADDGSTINLASQDLRALRMKAFHDMATNFPEAFAKFTTADS